MPPKLYSYTIDQAHNGPITTMCSSPKSGKIFASSGVDGIIKLWYVDTKEPLLCIQDFQDEITCITFNNTEELLAIGFKSGAVVLYDLEQDKVLDNWNFSNSKINVILFYYWRQTSIIIGDENGRIVLYTDQFDNPEFRISAHSASINCMQINTQTNTLATAGNDRLIKLFNLPNGNHTGTIKNLVSPVKDLAFHPKDPILATCSSNQTISLFNLKESILISEKSMIGSQPPTSIAFSLDGLAVIALSPSAIQLFKVSDFHVSNYEVFDLGCSYSLTMFKTCIAITSSFGSKISYSLLDTHDFPLTRLMFDDKGNKSVANNQNINKDNTVQFHYFNPDAIPKAKNEQIPKNFNVPSIAMKNKITTKSASNPTVYKDFSQDRQNYLHVLTNRLKLLGEIKESINSVGTDATISKYYGKVDYALVLLTLITGRRETIHIGNAADLLSLAHTIASSDLKMAVIFVDEVLEIVSPLIRSAFTEANSIRIMNVLHHLSPIIHSAMNSNDPISQVATNIVQNYHDILH